MNRTSNNWELKTFKDKVTLGLINKSDGFPIGLQYWSLQDNPNNSSVVKLKLSKVSSIDMFEVVMQSDNQKPTTSNSILVIMWYMHIGQCFCFTPPCRIGKSEDSS